jgi:hypothetical protein
LNERKFNFNIKREEELGKFWHKRIEHPSDMILKYLFNFSKLYCNSYEVCNLGKHTKLPFKLFTYTSDEPLKLVHSNVQAPAPIDSYNEYKYFIIFIEEFSNITWHYLMKQKSKVLSFFQNFVIL